jgi:hypothetical protein
MKTKFRAIVIAASALAAAPLASAQDETLSAGELRQLFPGRYDVNIFGRWSVDMRLAPGGVITGKVGRFADKGRWSIEGNQLCIAWSSWTSGKKGCSALTRNGRTISGKGFSFSL